MNDPLIPNFFGFMVACVFLVYLWASVLMTAKSRLRMEDRSSVKYFITLLSIPPAGIAVHCGFNIVGLFLGTAGSF